MEPKFKSPSYKPCDLCGEGHCDLAFRSTEEKPCWGEAGPFDEISYDGEDWYWIHRCQGHTDDDVNAYTPEPKGKS